MDTLKKFYLDYCLVLAVRLKGVERHAARLEGVGLGRGGRGGGPGGDARAGGRHLEKANVII